MDTNKIKKEAKMKLCVKCRKKGLLSERDTLFRTAANNDLDFVFNVMSDFYINHCAFI